jgi:hypothetical protein
MCWRYANTKDEAKVRLRDNIVVHGVVPRANIRPTELSPVIVPEYDGFHFKPSVHKSFAEVTKHQFQTLCVTWGNEVRSQRAY